MTGRAAAAEMTARRVAPALAAALFAACGAKAPEPLAAVPQRARPLSPEQIPSSQRTIFVHVAPPSMTIPDMGPDLSEEPRWPLSIMDHPKLEPHYDVAGVLAEPGIGWMELCARGVHKRRDPSHRDELAYLTAWCAAGHHDVRAAVTSLAPLLHSVVPEISNAVPFDLANILVESTDADHADQLFSDEGLRDPYLWDVLAASYFELGKNGDALHATSTALQLEPQAAAAVTCHRLTREILLGSDAFRDLVRKQLDALADGKAPDPTCVQLAASVSCSLEPGTGCTRFYRLESVDPLLANLWVLHEHWNQRRDWSNWIDVAWKAFHLGSADPVGFEMAIQALDAAIVAGNCEQKAMKAIETASSAMPTSALPEKLATEAMQIRALAGDARECTAFREHWLAAHPQ